MLAKRDYFKKELKNKLIEKIGFTDIVEDVVEDFEEKGYLDDYDKAKSYAKQHSNYGAKKLSFIFYQMACQCFSPDYFCKNGGFFIKMVKGYGRKNCQNGSCRPGKSVT